MTESQLYAPVLEALARQTKVINQLAKELKEEYQQYQYAVQARDMQRAGAIADAINKRTDRLADATDKPESPAPGADENPVDQEPIEVGAEV